MGLLSILESYKIGGKPSCQTHVNSNNERMSHAGKNKNT